MEVVLEVTKSDFDNCQGFIFLSVIIAVTELITYNTPN